MKIITVQIELGISHFDISNMNNKEAIVEFLNYKLHHDPDWFGDFGEENIVSIVDGI
jgi:hypothetical protein